MDKASIDDFFKLSSKEVARLLIGMEIERKDGEGIYVVTRTKPYHGETRHTSNMSRMHHGRIMMFNLRGSPHFCISTGLEDEQDYVHINALTEGDVIYPNAKQVSIALGMDLEYSGDRFTDYFKLKGQTQESTFTGPRDEASSCRGIYELVR